jgi:hypothetical protein
MDDRQIRWGLSGGTTVLAIAGFFWFGISFGVITTRFGWLVWSLSTAGQVAVTAYLIWAAVLLRRASGFSPGDSRTRSEQQRAETARVARAFGWTALAQGALTGAAVWLCVRSGAKDLVWPSIGLITSLHFAPLARVFHVRTYYVTALAGGVISLAGLNGLSSELRLAWFGGGMAAVMWLSAWYVVRHASRISAKAAQETWAV